ncbi:MAG: TIR domain-containing protein [Alphaproteobacteria bacterium]|nr:TIR domain-containing protein [Alphaproteobacteria bacterium]
MAIRHKCFISYHHADQQAVDDFVKTFDHHHDMFIVRQLGEMPEDIINSNDTDYVMRRIREDYIRDSTVTLVMMGKCTWARRYVDWEIQASLRPAPNTSLPNGLLGIKLPTFTKFPERFDLNLLQPNAAKNTNYAGYIDHPTSADRLAIAIDWAFARRSTHKELVNNPRERFSNNRQCP